MSRGRGLLPYPAAAAYICILSSLFHSVRGVNICTKGSATSCEECLLVHPKCAWCFKEEFGSKKSITSRCDFMENLIANGCAGHFESTKSSIQTVKNISLSSKGSSATNLDVTQIMPQKISLNLRPGDPISFQVQVRQVEDYPVDLYYLMDLSLSMKDDLENIQNLGTKLAEEMRKLTSNFRLGLGSSVDKNISPFSYTAPMHQNNPCTGYKSFPSCVPSFGFRHLLTLTDKADRFNKEVQKQKVSRNRDAPEGGLDAILQAAVCEKEIGWRKEASHLLVFTTDDGPHIALDGKLAGLVQPHDGQCHLNEANEYTASSQLDYPSLALIGEKLAENNIHLIFAVTKNYYVLYKNLTALIPGTTVEILHQDSRNIIQLIVKAYNSIRSKVELTVWDSPEDINLAFTATCQDGLSYPGVRKCGDLQIGDTVSFEISVEARSCPAENTSHTFTIKPDWFRDTLEVTVTYNCTCGCTKQIEHSSSKCSGNGTYMCGLCDCDPGHVGAKCECEEGESGNMYQNMCREAEGKRVCSGRGECSCNHCVCYESEFGKIYGLFCECDDFSCARYKGVLCSGHGECHCGECKCHRGYIGDNCNCSTETDPCLSNDGQMCSGRGNCICGKCHCTEPGAFGETCEKCPTCPGVCSTKRDCIECVLFNSGRLADNQTCQKHCRDEIITQVDVLKTDDPQSILCAYPVKDCVMKFTYSELPSGKTSITVLKEPECGTAPDVKLILLSVVGSIVLLGIIILAIWKLIVTMHDRKEFARFQSERSRARYEMASNPLYRKPISTHSLDFTFNKLNRTYNGTID
ncbi:integrin beta-5 isoform X1 [Hemicordylus capensis]|uniref:integrin beta-5 isoform X1 n=2 Tax=Hemicordylus capensis TaxID=884348 RepID=UPI002302A84D|nr:integrin beta-5 isoform X1 [Hemicordylus capensis]